LTEIASGNEKLDKVMARTKIIEHLVGLAKSNYANLQERSKEVGLDWQNIEKEILIRSIDTIWMDHIDVMSRMRQSVGLRGYGQRDPLVEYKRESHHMFYEMNAAIQKQAVYSIYKISIGLDSLGSNNFNSPTISDRAQTFSAPAKVSGKKGAETHTSTEIKNKFGKKVGRNELCPCGSGKKFKKCCGK